MIQFASEDKMSHLNVSDRSRLLELKCVYNVGEDEEDNEDEFDWGAARMESPDLNASFALFKLDEASPLSPDTENTDLEASISLFKMDGGDPEGNKKTTDAVDDDEGSERKPKNKKGKKKSKKKKIAQSWNDSFTAIANGQVDYWSRVAQF